MAIFPPARFSQLRVQCFFLALKKGSNNLASGSIFCSPSIFYWGHRQFLSTCSCSSTMYMCILYYTMYILSTSYILLRYVLQQLETGNPTIKKINQLSHGIINEDTSSTQYHLPRITKISLHVPTFSHHTGLGIYSNSPCRPYIMSAYMRLSTDGCATSNYY